MTTRRDFLKTLRHARRRRQRASSLATGRSARRAAPGAPGRGSVSRSRLPPARLVDRRSAQDNTATFYVGKTDLGQGTGTAFRQIMADELDMRLRQHQLRDGQHRRHRRSGRLRRIGRAADRRLADAPRGRRGAPRAARHGVARASACRSRSSPSATAWSRCAADPSRARHLRRADWRQALQRHADRQQHRRDHRHGAAQGGAGAARSSASRRSATTFRRRWTAR